MQYTLSHETIDCNCIKTINIAGIKNDKESKVYLILIKTHKSTNQFLQFMSGFRLSRYIVPNTLAIEDNVIK